MRIPQLLIGISFIGALYIVFLIMNYLGENYPLTNFPARGTRIVALGDSLTAGVGGTSGGYVPILEKRLGVHIGNAGKSGDTTGDALARLPDVLSEKPDILIILLGGNDALNHVPTETTLHHLEEIIARSQGEGALVLLVGIRGGVIGDPYGKTFSALAKRTGSAYVDNVMKEIFANTKYLSDEIHPNDAGYEKMADKIAPVLEGLIVTARKTEELTPLSL